ncbi:MAG: DinB family protein [Chloroflexi bacterium]|nr:MAG: DinB family protein [Chloroflexota bacterium]
MKQVFRHARRDLGSAQLKHSQDLSKPHRRPSCPELVRVYGDATVQVARLVVVDRSFVAANARELARMRAVVSRLSDRQLGAMVNEYWSVAGVLGHIAFWDGRALYLAGKLERGEPFTASDNEPEDVDWINDSSRPLLHAIPPRALAELAVSIAEETDEIVASLPDEMLAGLDETSPLNPVRANHRGEHLNEIEAAIRP